MANEGSLREYKARIQRVIDHVENDIRERLTSGGLAGVSGFSRYHFQEIFHAFVGETPDDFVNRIRLEKAACRLITCPGEPISEVAFVCGFPSASAFAKAFRERFGCSAREWRNGNLDGLLKGKCRKAGVKGGEPVSPASNRSDPGPMKAEIRPMPSFHIAYSNRLNGTRRNVWKLFPTLRRWADSRNLLTPDTKMIGISLDNPNVIPPQKHRYYACLTVPPELKPEAEIAITDIPASPGAVLRFEGDADGMPQACDWMFGKFIPENGYQPADLPSYEIYDGISDSHDKRFSVHICVPVEAMEA